MLIVPCTPPRGGCLLGVKDLKVKGLKVKGSKVKGLKGIQPAWIANYELRIPNCWRPRPMRDGPQKNAVSPTQTCPERAKRVERIPRLAAAPLARDDRMGGSPCQHNEPIPGVGGRELSTFNFQLSTRPARRPHHNSTLLSRPGSVFRIPNSEFRIPNCWRPRSMRDWPQKNAVSPTQTCPERAKRVERIPRLAAAPLARDDRMGDSPCQHNEPIPGVGGRELSTFNFRFTTRPARRPHSTILALLSRSGFGFSDIPNSEFPEFCTRPVHHPTLDRNDHCSWSSR